MGDQNYIAADSEFNTERDRLTVLENYLDPISIRHLNGLGVSPGWRCLDVGAGAGSIGRWLADRVGPGGHVVATDLNPRFLGRADRSNLVVRQHNIVIDELEEGEYDLVHCRYVFSHVRSDQKALERMVAALRPGGWLLIIDADWSFFRAIDPGHHSAEFFNALMKSFVAAGKTSGTLDPCCGGRLRERLEGVGLTDVGNEGVLKAEHGRSQSAKYLLMQGELFAPRLIPTGILTEKDMARFRGLMEDPTFYFATNEPAPTFAAWGRMPG